MEDIYAPITDIDEIKLSIKDLKADNLKSTQILARNLETQLQAKITPLSEQLRTKIDAELFDEEIDKLTNLIASRPHDAHFDPNNSHSTHPDHTAAAQSSHSSTKRVSQSLREKEQQKDLALKIEEIQITCLNFEKRFDKVKEIGRKVEEISETVPTLLPKSTFDLFVSKLKETETLDKENKLTQNMKF